MEKITDVIFTKQSTIRTKDPYSLAIEIKDIASRYGHIRERTHEYDTNGPRKLVRLVFEVVSPINKRTKTKLVFVLKGEVGLATGYLDIKVIAKSLTLMQQGTGLASTTFGEYYMKSIMPLLRKEGEKRLGEMASDVQDDVRAVLAKYA